MAHFKITYLHKSNIPSLCHDAEFGNVHENMAITITAKITQKRSAYTLWWVGATCELIVHLGWLDTTYLLLRKLALIVVIVDQRFLLAILRKPDSTSVEPPPMKILV